MGRHEMGGNAVVNIPVLTALVEIVSSCILDLNLPNEALVNLQGAAFTEACTKSVEPR